MNLKDQKLRAAVLGSLLNIVKDANEEERKTLLDALVADYVETGNKSSTISLPSGDKVATLTLNESKPETVITDRGQFMDWCRNNRPDLIEVVHHPAVEAWEETAIRSTAAARLADDYKVAGDMYLTPEGEPVDGVEYRLPKAPSKFTLSYTAKDRGASLVEAWRDGQLGVELGPQFPQLAQS